MNTTNIALLTIIFALLLSVVYLVHKQSDLKQELRAAQLEIDGLLDQLDFQAPTSEEEPCINPDQEFAFVDINRDGIRDIVVCPEEGDAIDVDDFYINDGEGFVPATTTEAGVAPAN